jgi:hypothetical protein
VVTVPAGVTSTIFCDQNSFVDKALAIAQTKRTNTLGDFYLIKGQLLLMKEPKATRKAQQLFSSAIEISRKSGAKSDELSATIESARLLMQQNRHAQARAKLGKIYNWYTEGFDAADLKDAKALLDEIDRKRGTEVLGNA